MAMAHSFDRTERDPYVEVAEAVDAHLFRDNADSVAGAEEQIYDVLGNAIVGALGDIAAQAFRHGVNGPEQMGGLAKAVAASCAAVFESYRGEVDPEPALHAIESDPRLPSLSPEARNSLQRELGKTRRLEHLLLTAKRLPALLEFVGSLGLHVPAEVLDEGTLLVGEYPTPTAPA